MSNAPEQPNPGSNEAVALGCTCPVLDNGRGNPELGRTRGFYYSGDCPVHNPEQPTQPASIEEEIRSRCGEIAVNGSLSGVIADQLIALHKARMEALAADIKKTCLERNQFRGMQNNIAQDTFESYVDQTLARHLGGTNE